MGQTNTNVVQHFCSGCRNVRPFHDFPYPKVVWWCRACWRQHRRHQNDKRRQKRQIALEQNLFKFHPRNWHCARYRSKGGLAVLSGLQKQQAWAEFNKLIHKCKANGVLLTSKKTASLWGNAIHIVKNVRTGKVRSWISNHRKRMKLWKRLQKQQEIAEFKARPLSQRCKVLPSL